MNRLKPALIALTALSSLALSGLAAATTYPLSVTDDLGRKITIQNEPRRIVAMLPSHTETLFAIGAGGKLVGIDEYSNYPKAETDKIQKVGSGFEPNLEAIIGLKPDLVLADESTSSPLVQKLTQAGLTVYGGTAQTYNEVFEKIAVIGKITNRETRAVKLISGMRAELGKIEASVRALPKVTAYFELDPTPYAAGQNSFIGTLMTKAGGLNVIPAGLGEFPQISPELVVNANPAAILGVSLDDVLKRPGWASIAAVKNKRVLVFPEEINDAIVRPGPRLPVALRAIAMALHPELK